MKKPLLYVLAFAAMHAGYGQENKNYQAVYPLGEDPNLRYLSSNKIQHETIIFDANPNVRYSFKNDFVRGLQNNRKHTQAWYLSFRPQIRIFTDNSKPVKTPSYKLLFGTQHLIRLSDVTDTRKQDFFGIYFETGHFSNGQTGGAFTEDYEDGSPESEAIYRTITPQTKLSDILNRKSGNFSTNLTELILNWRTYGLDDDYYGRSMWSVSAGYTLYHNRLLGIIDFAGYTQNDIKIYGRHRFYLGGEYMQYIGKQKNRRIVLRENLEIISKAHASVNPLRNELSFTIFPFPKTNGFGFFTSLINGHDNYNYRFVDSGTQVSVGITWAQFPPIALKKLAME